MAALLTMNELDVRYGSRSILKGVSMDVERGMILGVVGESGSGKSTTIYAILGILGKGGVVTDGRILYDGQELLTLSKEDMRRLRGKKIGFIAQNPVETFHPVRKIRAQLYELVKCHGILSCQEAEIRMLSLMEKMKLKDGRRILDSYAFEMSGGMCQRVSIAMGMVLQPELLLADEPTSALDVTAQKLVVEELMKIRNDYGTAMLIVSHNMGVISAMSDRVAVMYAGIIVEYGAETDVIQNAIHPYTQNLVRAVPTLDKPAPKGIRVFTYDREQPGCPFCNACPNVRTLCREQLPALTETTSGHFVRCWNI